MKKILYILCAMLAFASCSKEGLPKTEDCQNIDGSYTFNLGIEESDYAPKTRAAVTIGRYMLEMYEGDLTATPTKQSNTTGVFTVEMKKNTDYVCLFWADNGTDYTVTNLKAVRQTTETALGTAAYFAKETVNSKTFNGAVTLKRAVAELSFIDKNGLTEATNSLKIIYPYASATFNLADGTVTHATGSTVRTIANIAPPTDKSTAFATDFVLAPTASGVMQGLKLQLNTEAEKTIAEITIQANYRTKITGEYQPKPTPLAVGDFYMSDGTWLPGATTLTAEQQAACIGIVYWTGDPTKDDAALKAAHPNCTNGLVVALKEDGPSAWQSTFKAYAKTVNEWTTVNTSYAPIISGDALTDPINKIMGYNNTKAIEAFNAANSANKVEAIEKVAAYQTAVPTPASNSGWFLPSTKELTLLCGLVNQDKNVFEDIYGTGNRDAINAQLAKIDGSIQISKNHWSSTEGSRYAAWLVLFDKGITNDGIKNLGNTSVRVVSAF